MCQTLPDAIRRLVQVLLEACSPCPTPSQRFCRRRTLPDAVRRLIPGLLQASDAKDCPTPALGLLQASDSCATPAPQVLQASDASYASLTLYSRTSAGVEYLSDAVPLVLQTSDATCHCLTLARERAPCLRNSRSNS